MTSSSGIFYRNEACGLGFVRGTRLNCQQSIERQFINASISFVATIASQRRVRATVSQSIDVDFQKVQVSVQVAITIRHGTRSQCKRSYYKSEKLLTLAVTAINVTIDFSDRTDVNPCDAEHRHDLVHVVEVRMSSPYSAFIDEQQLKNTKKDPGPPPRSGS